LDWLDTQKWFDWLPIPVHQTRSAKPAVRLIRASLPFLKDIHHNPRRDHCQLPMALKGVKASKVFQKKSKAKVIEWVTREHSRGTRYIPVDVSTSTSQQTQGRDTVRMEIDNHEAVLHEADLPSMDVDGSFWIEEPVIPEQRRVSSPTCPFSTICDKALSLNAPSWKSLFLELAPTCIASSVLRGSRLRECARAACLLHLSGGAPTAFLLWSSARSVAETPTNGFLSTEFSNGQGNTSCHHG
jgi:hypothetical protein